MRPTPRAPGPVRRVTSGIPAVVTPPPRIAAVIRHVAWMRVDACLRQADEALYAGKAGGRNRVVSAARA